MQHPYENNGKIMIFKNVKKFQYFVQKPQKTQKYPFFILYLDSLLKTTQEFLFHKKFGGTKKKNSNIINILTKKNKKSIFNRIILHLF